MAKIETREVLADAYRRQSGTMLSHAVEVNDHGPVRALCGRVRVDSIADRYASDPDSQPTCAICRRKDPRGASVSGDQP